MSIFLGKLSREHIQQTFQLEMLREYCKYLYIRVFPYVFFFITGTEENRIFLYKGRFRIDCQGQIKIELQGKLEQNYREDQNRFIGQFTRDYRADENIIKGTNQIESLGRLESPERGIVGQVSQYWKKVRFFKQEREIVDQCLRTSDSMI